MLIGAPTVFENVRVGTMILELPLQPHYRPRPHGHRSTGAIAMFEAEQAHGLSVEGESDGKSPSYLYARGLVLIRAAQVLWKGAIQSSRAEPFNTLDRAMSVAYATVRGSRRVKV